jgi:hypothetical protein
MPNGFQGSKQEWQRVEAPLHPLTPALEDFARRHGMRIAYSEHNWPSRSLHWGDDFERVIQISLENPQTLTWDVWVYAWQDRDRRRYWKKAALRRAVRMAEIASSLAQMLREGKGLADEWRPEDLEFAIELPK